MSTITETQAVPAGTWGLDKVHSAIGFAVDYLAGTFQGSFSDYSAELKDGVLRLSLPREAKAQPRRIEVRAS